MKTSYSKVPFSYKSIKITQSRIDKGLLAIPVSLIDFLPKNKNNILVAFGTEDELTPKHFTPYSSSSRECRIGGMRSFYKKFQIKNGDEIVIQLLDDEKYRLIPEILFEKSIRKLEDQFDQAKDDNEAELTLIQVSKISNVKIQNVALNEYRRLSNKEITRRKYKLEKLTKRKESVPVSFKNLLAKIYEGKCQVSGFTFNMRNGKPYSEIHHIKPEIGNHIKNLLVVCPNIHAQFTYAFVEELFDQDGWLRKVKINNDLFNVNQIIDQIPNKFKKEIHFE